MVEGFFPKASALFKKLLKLTPDDEASQLNLADISQKQGLLADAKARLNAVAAKRRARGDQTGTAEIVVLLGSLDPGLRCRNAAPLRLPKGGSMRPPRQLSRHLRGSALKDRPADALAPLRQAFEPIPPIRGRAAGPSRAGRATSKERGASWTAKRARIPPAWRPSRLSEGGSSMLRESFCRRARRGRTTQR